MVLSHPYERVIHIHSYPKGVRTHSLRTTGLDGNSIWTPHEPMVSAGHCYRLGALSAQSPSAQNTTTHELHPGCLYCRAKKGEWSESVPSNGSGPRALSLSDTDSGLLGGPLARGSRAQVTSELDVMSVLSPSLVASVYRGGVLVELGKWRQAPCTAWPSLCTGGEKPVLAHSSLSL